MSGEMNTSLSNGFANYMMFLFVTRNSEFSDCVIEGDDCLGVVKGRLPTKEDYEKMGFRIKLEKHDDLSTASFCGLLFDPFDRQLIKEPTKVLLNLGWVSALYRDSKSRTLRQLAKSKVMSLLCEVPHCPILGPLAFKIFHLLKIYKMRIDVTDRYHMSRLDKFRCVAPRPTMRTRTLFQKLFGVTIELQLLIERRIAKLKTFKPLDIEEMYPLFSDTTYWYDYVYVRQMGLHKLTQLGVNIKMTKANMNKQRNRIKNQTKRLRKKMNRINEIPMKQNKPSNQPARGNQPSSRTGFQNLSGIGSLIGTTLGSAYGPGGAALGSALGGLGGGLIGKIFGRGDYDVKFNTLVRASPVPEFPNANCIRFKHREYIQDISGSVGFVNNSFPINPGLSTSYPLLAAIASCFQQYCLVGQLYEFVSTSANALNSTNTALGTVIMATDYDSLDSAFTTKQAMMATLFSNAGKPSESMLHAIECSPTSTPVNLLYTRSAGVPAGGDQRLYDLGVFQIATQGMQAVANIGELWVTYDIILCKPVLSTLINSPLTDAYFSGHAFNSTWLSSMALVPGQNNIGTTVSGNVITFPNDVVLGNYIVLLTAYGANTYTAPTITPVGATILSYLNGGSNNSLFTPTSTNNYAALIIVNVTIGGATLTFSGTVPTLIVPADLLILKASSVF